MGQRPQQPNPNGAFTDVVRAEAERFKSGLPAANDGELTPEDVDAEVRRLEADAHYNKLKNTGFPQRVEWYARQEVEALRRDGRLA